MKLVKNLLTFNKLFLNIFAYYAYLNCYSFKVTLKSVKINKKCKGKTSNKHEVNGTRIGKRERGGGSRDGQRKK